MLIKKTTVCNCINGDIQEQNEVKETNNQIQHVIEDKVESIPKKRCVEDCLLVLNIDKIKSNFIGGFWPIVLDLKNFDTGKTEPFCTINHDKNSFEQYYYCEGEYAKHAYIITFDTKNQKIYVAIDKVISKKGKQHWWFVCPKCCKRVKKLYMPENNEPIKCRRCHNLTYINQQTHDARLDDKNLEKTMYNQLQRLKNSRTERQYFKNQLKIAHFAFKMIHRKKI